MPVVTIFGGSHTSEKDPDYKIAFDLGRELARAGFTLCNGGYSGVMEASARGAKEGGGKTIAVSTSDFGGKVNPWMDQEIKASRWSERLFKLIEFGDAYFFFDGGTGTLVELFTVWEMLNKKFFSKPVLVFGRDLQALISEVRKFPQTVDNPQIYFCKDVPEAVSILLRKS